MVDSLLCGEVLCLVVHGGGGGYVLTIAVLRDEPRKRCY